MAILYYPAGSKVAQVNAWNPGYEQIYLNVNPNMVFYFDTGSVMNAASASNLYITASWAETASVSFLFSSNSFQSVSSSYAATASLALNAVAGGGGGGINSSSFTTISTGSSRWITASFWEAEQYVSITAAALYNFTCSNPAPAGTMSYTTLFIDNTALATCSLSFPSDWKFIGSLPSSLSSSRVAVLSLRSYGGTRTIATFGVQY